MQTSRREFLVALTAAVAGCRLAGLGQRAKFSFNPSTFREFKLSLEDQVRLAAAAGFTGFEPWLKDIRVADAAGKLPAIRRMAEDAGLEFVNGIAFGFWSHPDAKIRAEGLEETKRDMEMLRRLGCPHIAASLCGIHRPGSPKVTLGEIAERYAAVLELGRREGVRPLLEYWGHSVVMSTPEQALSVVDMVKDRDAAVLADVFHTYKGGGSFDAFRRFSPHLLPVLHVNDYPNRPREELTDADRIWPGDGVAPWDGLLADLKLQGCDPWLSLELFNLSYQRDTPEWTVRRGYEKMAAAFAER